MKLTIEISRRLTKKESRAFASLLESLSRPADPPATAAGDAPPPQCGPGEPGCP